MDIHLFAVTAIQGEEAHTLVLSVILCRAHKSIGSDRRADRAAEACCHVVYFIHSFPKQVELWVICVIGNQSGQALA